MKMNMKRTVLGLSLLLSIFEGGLYAADAFTPEEAAGQLDQLSLQDQRALVIQEVQARLKKGEEPQKLAKNVKSFIKKMKGLSDNDKDALLAGLEDIIAGCQSCNLVAAASDVEPAKGSLLPFEAKHRLDFESGDSVSILFPFLNLTAMPYGLADTHVVVEQGCAEIVEGERIFMYPLCPCVAVIAKAHDRAFIAHVYTAADLSDLVGKMKKFKDCNGIEEIKMYSVAHPARKTVKWQESVLEYVNDAFKEHDLYGTIFTLNSDQLGVFKNPKFVDLASSIAKTIIVDHQGTIFHASVAAACVALGRKAKDYEAFVAAAQKAVWGGTKIPKGFCNAKIPACLLSNLKK